MHRNVIFIGGIHGVGKGTICSKISHELNMKHLSSSEVLKWSEISPTENNKLVKDIPETQNRLIKELSKLLKPEENYILDGHFCLFDSSEKIIPVDIQTFIKISPIIISVVTCNPKTIIKRLEKRDKKKYELPLIEKFQNTEINQGKLVSAKLEIPFIQLNDDISELVETINYLRK